MVRHKVNGSWREVRSTPDCHGRYQIIALWKDGKRKTFMLHNLVSEAFGIPVEDVKRKLYQGFRLDPEAKTRVRSWLYEKLAECRKNSFARHDEILYLKEFLKIVSEEEEK